MASFEKLQEIIPQIIVPNCREAVHAAIQPSIRLKTDKSIKPLVGETKLGGIPDFTDGQKWPVNKKGNPMAFVAQINLRAIAQNDVFHLLPPTGILHFFYDWESWLGGAVQYTLDNSPLKAAIPPEDLTRERKTWWQKMFGRPGRNMMLTECGVFCSTEYYLPDYDSVVAELIMLEKEVDAVKDIYIDDAWETTDYFEELDNGSNHHILGYYQAIQHNGYETEFVENIKNSFNRKTVEVLKAAKEWLLLFQLDSDEALNFSIGDWGRAYFFIHQDDLKNLRFERVKVVGDCY